MMVNEHDHIHNVVSLLSFRKISNPKRKESPAYIKGTARAAGSMLSVFDLFVPHYDELEIEPEEQAKPSAYDGI